MSESVVTGVLWVLVGVCLVLYFDGLVTESRDRAQWSSFTPKPALCRANCAPRLIAK